MTDDGTAEDLQAELRDAQLEIARLERALDLERNARADSERWADEELADVEERGRELSELREAEKVRADAAEERVARIRRNLMADEFEEADRR